MESQSWLGGRELEVVLRDRKPFGFTLPSQ